MFCGAKQTGQFKVKDFLLKRPPLFSICTYFCPALIPPQKTALHTHSALKLLLEGEEALKGLNPRADGTRARMGPDSQDGRGKKANSKEVEVKRLPEKWLVIENMVMFWKNTRMTQSLCSLYRNAPHLSFSPFIHAAFSLLPLLTTVNTFQEGS